MLPDYISLMALTHTCMSSWQKFLNYFAAQNTPAPICVGFSAPDGLLGKIHSLLLSATDRLAFAMAALFGLVEGISSGKPVSGNDIQSALKHIAVGSAQSYVQQVYIRRYLVLQRSWLDHTLHQIREILKTFSSSTLLLSSVPSLLSMSKHTPLFCF